MKQVALILLAGLIALNVCGQNKNAPAAHKGKNEKARYYREPDEELTVASHNLYADLDLPPGFSVTYNYRFAKHFGVGAGFQGYNVSPTLSGHRHFTPAVFGDVRLIIRPQKTNQFFSFLDMGINFYKPDGYLSRERTTIYTTTEGNGFYAGLGFGYFRKATKNGGGPYAALKMITNWYRPDAYNFATHQRYVSGWVVGDLALSFGFKF